jgi:protein-disulfide isomerase
MILNHRFDSLLKTAALCTAGVLLLSACSDKGESTTHAAVDGRSSFETVDDHALGNPDAPITIVEYASVTCGHCANWNNTVWDDFREKYVDTGKVRYVFREFPTQPVELATAGHLLANCAGDDKFFDLIHVQFKRQQDILYSDDKKGEYVRLAKTAGMSEADFDACMQNETEITRLDNVVNEGFNAGVTGTPTFFLNGKKVKAFVLADFDKLIAEELGEPLPEPTPEAGEETDAPAKAEGADH